MADGHAKWFKPNAVYGGFNWDPNNSGTILCGAGPAQGIGGGGWYIQGAASTECSDPAIAATFSID